MRNTDQYPITVDEMIEACNRAAADIIAGWEQLPPGQMPIGGITPMALREAAQRLERMQFAMWDGRRSKKRQATKSA